MRDSVLPALSLLGRGTMDGNCDTIDFSVILLVVFVLKHDAICLIQANPQVTGVFLT